MCETCKGRTCDERDQPQVWHNDSALIYCRTERAEHGEECYNESLYRYCLYVLTHQTPNAELCMPTLARAVYPTTRLDVHSRQVITTTDFPEIRPSGHL